MTVKEATAIYAVYEYITSVGDNLTRIVRLLYGTDNDKAFATIKELNHRFDWSCLEGGVTIKYFPEDILSNIDVVFGKR
jgi:hypothetical protein